MNENTLYLECYSGISGDMTVAALLDLGADQQVLLDGLKSLKVDGYRIEIGRRLKNSIDACDFNVILDQEYNHEFDSVHAHTNEHNHEHDHNHPHSHEHEHFIEHQQDFDQTHEHYHSHEHHQDLDYHPDYVHSHTNDHHQNHNHDHEYTHEHHPKDLHPHQDHHHSKDHQNQNYNHEEITHGNSHLSNELIDTPTLTLGHHAHRNLNDINLIIDGSNISKRAKDLAKKIFHIIAVAEAKAHAKPLDEVHFHEVGAIDSIVDIVATAICLDNLNISQVIVSELYEGTGQIRCQHGLLPIPVPGVANISADYNLPLHITNVKGELVTPTGAAIVAAIKTGNRLPSEIKIKKIGLGAGKRNYEGASGILRAMLIEDATALKNSTKTDQVWVLEANIDDCSGEMLSLAMELLLQNGAKDVYYTPIYMKKNRPAYQLGVICSEDKVTELERIIFIHTTTIGIRKYKAERTILPREQKTIMTPYGEAFVKLCNYEDKSFIYPEYESVKKLCQKTGQDYQTIYHEIQKIAKGQ